LDATGQGKRPLVLAVFAVGSFTFRRAHDKAKREAPAARWAEAIDARTGRSVWRQRFKNRWFAGEDLDEDYPGPQKMRGPWVLRVDGRTVLVCVAGTHLIGLDPHTGKPVWKPVDLGFMPVGTPAFADLDGDGRIDMVLRGPDQETDRAVTIPAGKVLWKHQLPKERGWVAANPGSGFLRDPLPIGLDGDGKAEVIVPAERGAIAVLDGPSGRLRWQGTVAINQGRPSAACVLVGPDLDGDGCRDLFVSNVISDQGSHKGDYLSPVIRVQALSGQTGQALWRCHFPIPKGVFSTEVGVGLPLVAWQQGKDGWPMLVVPGKHHTLVVEAGSGQVVHVIPGLRGPFRAIDLDGDSIPELIGYQPSRQRNSPGRLHRFRGSSPEVWRRLGRENPKRNRGGDGPRHVGDLDLAFEKGRLVGRRRDPARLLWRSSLRFPPDTKIKEVLAGGNGIPAVVVVRSPSEQERVTTLFGLDARTGVPRWRHRSGSWSEPEFLHQAAPRRLPLVVEWNGSPGWVCSRVVATDQSGRAQQPASGSPVQEQAESVEWVPFPWVGKMTPKRGMEGSGILLALAGMFGFPAYVGFRILRKGWSSLWFSASAYLVLVIGVIVVYLVKHAGLLQPWQRYSWDGWYWVLFVTLVWAGLLTLYFLGILGFLRFAGRLDRLVRGQKSEVRGQRSEV
jgi:outer membrane protein assembly factor BamB